MRFIRANCNFCCFSKYKIVTIYNNITVHGIISAYNTITVRCIISAICNNILVILNVMSFHDSVVLGIHSSCLLLCDLILLFLVSNSAHANMQRGLHPAFHLSHWEFKHIATKRQPSGLPPTQVETDTSRGSLWHKLRPTQVGSPSDTRWVSLRHKLGLPLILSHQSALVKKERECARIMFGNIILCNT